MPGVWLQRDLLPVSPQLFPRPHHQCGCYWAHQELFFSFMFWAPGSCQAKYMEIDRMQTQGNRSRPFVQAGSCVFGLHPPCFQPWRSLASAFVTRSSFLSHPSNPELLDPVSPGPLPFILGSLAWFSLSAPRFQHKLPSDPILPCALALPIAYPVRASD